MTCPACQADTGEGARFCAECGTPLALRCPGCGSEHRPGQRFCDQCGTALAAAPTAAPAAPVAENRVVSVLFVDLVGYTSLSETRDAEDVRELLSGYFDTARTVVGRYGGTVEKFIGDAVMAVWGTPVAREDDAELAVRAALELVDAVAAFGERVGAPELRARAGVVTGQVASVAADGEGLVVGDRVNTAARVQSAAVPGTVLVDEVTRQASSAAIDFEDAGVHTVKGKAEALHLWRALRVVAGVAGAQREQGLVAPFVGRDAELRLVKDLFHGVADRGAARLVAVSGAAGVGKTRLHREFEHYVDGLADVALWHSGRCPSYGDGVAYWALAEMVRQRLGIAEDAAPEEAARRLALGLEQWVLDAEERAYLAPRIGALIGTADPGLERQELHSGWRLFFERLADHEPVVLVFEDLQWADDGLLDFVDHLLVWSAQTPIFVLALSRPELLDRRPDWSRGRPGVTPVFLEPLPDSAVGTLLDGLVAGLPQEVRSRIVAQAEGIPLYALETVRALADRGLLGDAGDGRLVVAGEVGELEVPATLTSLLTARLDALDADERSLVKRLAVLGGSFAPRAASALAEMSEAQVQALLASLVAKQVLVVRADPLSPDSGHYVFAQTLLRTVAFELLTKRERKPLHLAAATYLRTAFPNDGEEVAEAVAAHLLDAYHAAEGDADADTLRADALAALVRAAQRASSIGAPGAALRAYRTAIGLATGERERADLAHLAGEAAMVVGDHEQAVELFATALEVHAAAGRSRETARLTGEWARAMRTAGRGEEALGPMQEALAALRPAGFDADEAWLLEQLSNTLSFLGRMSEALPLLERARAAAEALELDDAIGRLLGASALAASFAGQFEYARALYDGAVAYNERRGATWDVMRDKSNLSDVLLCRDAAGAVARAREAMAIARRLGSRDYHCIAAGILLCAKLLNGEWDEMAGVAAESFEVSDSDPQAADVHYPLAVLASLRGDVEAAQRHLDGMASWETGDDVEMRSGHHAAAAAVALAAGRLEEALDHARAAFEAESSFRGAKTATRLAWPDAIDAALALGRLDAADELVAALAERPSGIVPPYLRAELRRARGLIAAARGDGETAERELAAAVEGLTALDYPYPCARAQAALAGVVAEAGRTAEAAELLDAAAGTFARLGAAPAFARLQAARGVGTEAVAAL